MPKLSEKNINWLKDKGYIGEDGRVTFSDRFIAILSKTTRRGNSLKRPIHAAHEHGMIPKKMLPASSDMDWETYHDPSKITRDMLKLGQEFKNIFPTNYERTTDIKKSLEDDMVIVGGYAWPEHKNGVYGRTEARANHAFLNYEVPKDRFGFDIFDNYIDSHDGDFMKMLANDYKFLPYGYRLFIPEINEPGRGSGFFKRFFSFW